MKLTNEQYAQALYEALQEASLKDHDKIIDNFISILKANNDLGRYEKIIEAYERLDRDKRGVKQVQLTFARETEVNGQLMDQLNSIVGGKAEVKTKIDDQIIGGVVIRVDDTLIDASMNGQLERLKNQLIH